MRKLTVLLSLFMLAMSPVVTSTPVGAGSNSGSPVSATSQSEIDTWVVRLAIDFGVFQNTLEEVITRPGVSDSTKLRLKLLEQSLRGMVMRVVVAAQHGDRETVRRYLPSIARSIRKQILVLAMGKDVTGEWAAALAQAYQSVTTVAQLTPEHWGMVVARIVTGGDRIQNA